MPVEISVQRTARKNPKAKTLTKRIPKKVASHFHALGLTDPELSIVLTDDAEIRELNREWRGEDESTDVLSFPLWEPFQFDESQPDAALGDIVISLETAERYAATLGHRDRVAESLAVPAASLQWSFEDEVDFLVIHGLLHLLGHDHLESEDEDRMRAEERRLWLASREVG